jgi:hypothetical protein
MKGEENDAKKRRNEETTERTSKEKIKNGE